MVGRLRWLILSATLLLLAPWPVLGAEPAVPKEAQDLLREAQRSRGGIVEMARVAEIRRQGELVLATSDGERIVPLRVVVRPPGHLVLETGAGDDLVRREFMDGKAWEVRSDGQPRELSPEEAARFRNLVMVDEAFLVGAALAGDLLITGVEDAGPGQVSLDLPAADGRAVLLQNTAGADYRLVLPVGGGLPLRVDYSLPGEQPDSEHALSDVFARWRVVEGLLFPAEVILYRDARAISAARYSTIEVELLPESPSSPAVSQP
ncbi:MAG: hypothetical protein O7A07_06240 [Acidobacteria bacterium]|nr:hypothetical protein [Acidobacteriota bacterium]